MKTELEAKLHPRVSEEFLRQEYLHYKAHGQTYNEWLQFMHDQRQGKSMAKYAESDTGLGPEVSLLIGIGVVLLAAVFCCFYMAATA